MVLLLLACHPVPDSPIGRFSAVGGLDADDRWLYVAGGGKGTGSDDILDDAWRLDTATHAWERIGDLPEPMLRGTAVRHDDILWIFGGTSTGWVDSDRLYAWDLATDAWEEVVVAGPQPRFKHAAAIVDGAMWVQGGHSDDDEDVIYDELWSFEFDGRLWTRLSPTGGPGPIHRQALAYDAARRALWCHGGFQDPDGAGAARSDRLWRLDVDTLDWQEVVWAGDGPPVRASHLIAMSGDDLVVWGGNGDDEQVWRFNPDTSTWRADDATASPDGRDAMVTDVTADGATAWLFGGDPASRAVPAFVADVWTLELATSSWVPVDTR